MNLKALVRTVPDYPKPGILFRDITTLLADGAGFKKLIEQLATPYRGSGVTKVAGIEARGFILGGAVATQLGVGFVPIRKKGKLPSETVGYDYDLEYGADRVEIHRDAVAPGEQVLIVDDLIATGGTALAAFTLLRRLGARPDQAVFAIELPALGGRARLEQAGCRCDALMTFDGH